MNIFNSICNFKIKACIFGTVLAVLSGTPHSYATQQAKMAPQQTEEYEMPASDFVNKFDKISSLGHANRHIAGSEDQLYSIVKAESSWTTGKDRKHKHTIVFTEGLSANTLLDEFAKIIKSYRSIRYKIQDVKRDKKGNSYQKTCVSEINAKIAVNNPLCLGIYSGKDYEDGLYHITPTTKIQFRFVFSFILDENNQIINLKTKSIYPIFPDWMWDKLPILIEEDTQKTTTQAIIDQLIRDC